MHLSSLLVLGISAGAWAAPVDQQPLAEHEQRADPYTPDYRDPYDRKVDATAEKLQPMPYVSCPRP